MWKLAVRKASTRPSYVGQPLLCLQTKYVRLCPLLKRNSNINVQLNKCAKKSHNHIDNGNKNRIDSVTLKNLNVKYDEVW